MTDTTHSNAPTDGWLKDGGLLYRLTDERRPQNRDEIRVMMADGSRSEEACARRAGELLDRIRAPQPQAVQAQAAEPAPLEKAVEAMVSMLEEGEWAEHVSTVHKHPLAVRLESCITDLHNEIREARGDD